MNEAEWLGADSPLGMLRWLCEGRGPSGHYVRHGPVRDRKLRLFACACCRAAWRLLTDEASRWAVEAAERCADGRLSHGEAVRASAAAIAGSVSGLAWHCTRPDAESCAWNAVHRLRCDGRLSGVDSAALLREVVGNPFRGAAVGRDLLGCPRCNGVALDDHGCPCRFGPLREAAPLARAAYERRALGEVFHLAGVPCRDEVDGRLDPARLAVLADALEDGGCESGDILAHLHSPGPHYRGCWALDLVLGLS